MPAPSMILLSTAYFPTIEYFYYLIHADDIRLDLYETYSKQTWRNRCRIMTGNGPADLSIPVEKPYGNQTKTREILISKHLNWQKNHWRTLESAYRNAPFFLYYQDLVESFVMDSQTEYLYELNSRITMGFLEEMGQEKSIKNTDDFIRERGEFYDLRFVLSPKARDRENFPVLAFEPYYQVFDNLHGFQPNLSVLDLIFNLGPDAAAYLQALKPERIVY